MSGNKSIFGKYLSIYNDAKEVLGLFRNQYSVLPAVTPELADKAFNMRYKVYCSELGFEPKNGAEAERDKFDAVATQLVLQYKPLEATIGCARFVPARQGGVIQTLPMQETCGDRLNQDIIKRIQDSGRNYSELSRLAVDRDFRKAKVQGVSGKSGRMGSSCASLMLFIGIQTYSKLSNTDYLFAIVEQKLINSFRKLKIPVESLGEPVDHHGIRYPIVIDIQESLRTFPPALIRPICRTVEEEMLKLMEVHVTQQLHAGHIPSILGGISKAITAKQSPTILGAVGAKSISTVRSSGTMQ